MIRPPSLPVLLLATAVAAPGHATPALDHYAALPESERRAIEYDLIWIGGTDAVTNGVVGRQSLQAIRAFERRIGTPDDGILRPRERRTLARAADRAREDAGYEIVVDGATGSRIGIPFAYVGDPVATRLGARYEAADGGVAVETYRLDRGPDLEQIYRRQIARPGRAVTYEVFRDDWFVVAGTEGGRRFYTRARTDGGEVQAYTIDYDPVLKPELDATIVAMSNDFDAFADEPDRPAPRRVAARDVSPAASDACGPLLRVAAGDTLARIAARCGVTVRDLRLANDGIRPLELQAGQTLYVPAGGGTVAPRPEPEVVFVDDAPSYAPTASYSPRRPTEDGVVRVEAAGFPPGRTVELGFLGADGLYRAVRDERTDARGRVEASLRLPDAYEDGDVAEVLLATLDGRFEATAGPFAIREGNRSGDVPARARIAVEGMLTSEGTSCQALRGPDGALYTLAGSNAALEAGTPVRVTGFEATRRDAAECGQGTTIDVRILQPR